LFLILIKGITYSQEISNKNTFLGEMIIDYLKTKYPAEVFSNFIYVGINRQRLYLFDDSKLTNLFKVSTAEKGAGNNHSSNQTPFGVHYIKKKIGDNAPIGTLFVNKINTGKIVPINKTSQNISKDEITSRILVLSGKEEGINKGNNKDTFSRGIYIHGTSDEASIGYPKSHGCIRMKNTDIIQLYNMIEEGLLVVLLNN
tara:strand:- start:16471 stop:17070 length:600 start_codon:yes stop_codon:yes gene_type:complete